MNEVPNPKIRALQAGAVLGEVEITPGGEALIGRNPECAVVIDDGSVSRVHARIFADEEGVHLEDLGSSNGTFVDGERVSGVRRLRDGQVAQAAQCSSFNPVLVQFQDPAERLLRQMGLSEDGRRPPEDLAGDVAPPQDPDSPGMEEGDEEDGPSPAEAEELPPVARRRPWADPATLTASLVTFVAVGVFLLWMVHVFRPSRARWSTVEVSPAEVAGGTELVLRSADIYPRSDLRVRLGGEVVERVKVLVGRLIIDVPPLPGLPAGRHALPLRVESGEFVVFQSPVTYEMRPVIRAVVPTQVRVGQTVSIDGAGFTESPVGARVLFGHIEASVAEASPSRLVVRVPPVTRSAPREVALKVEIPPWSVRASQRVEVAPRRPQPLALDFAASFRPDIEAWEVASPLGPVFYLEHPAGSNGSSPAELGESVERLGELFERAAEDSELTIAVEGGSAGGYTLQARSPGSEPVPLVHWNDEDLAINARVGGSRVSTEVLAFWMASVWADWVEVFSRGNPLPMGANPPDYRRALNRLVELNWERGGLGRPEMADVERLTKNQRLHLERAFVSPSASLLSVAGNWRVGLTNLFFPGEDYKVALELALKQKGRRLSGAGRILFAGEHLTFGKTSATVRGRVEPDVPPRVHLEMDFEPPVGRLTLDGTVGQSWLEGSFASSLVPGSGLWQATR